MKPAQTASGPNANKDGASHLRPIARKSRDREVLDALARMVEDAGLKAGDRLPTETELSAKLDVGRSTVREALKTWESLGIVVRKQGTGTRLAMNISSTAVQVPMVLQLEAEGLLRTQQVRRALEVEAVRLAALNHARINKDELRGLADTLLETVERGDPWREADAAFHAAIYRASGNPLFEQIIEQLHAAFHRVYVEPFNDDSYGIASMPAHRDLAEAVIAGKDAEAVRIITEIMDTTESEIKRLMGKR